MTGQTPAQHPAANLLFVDDDRNALKALQRLFRGDEYHVHLAESAAAALEILGQHAIDLIISDMRMPQMDGVEFLTQAAERWPDTVRIILTGYSDIESTIAAINNAKIYSYCSKPWEDIELKILVNNALEQKRLREERQQLFEIIARQNQELKALMEQTLKDSEQRFRTVVETVPDVLYQSSLPDFVTTYVSPSISDLLGFTAEECLEDRQLWIKQLHCEDRERILRDTEAAIAKKLAKTQHEYRIWHKNGRDLLWLQDHVTITYDSQGNATGIVGSLSDITELKRSQSDLQKTSRTLKTLSYCNTTLVHATDELSLLQAMCHIVVDIGGYMGAWVGYAQHDKAKTLQPMAQSGFAVGYIEALNPTWANSGFGASPSGKAVRTGKKQIARHLRNLVNTLADAAWCAAEIKLGVASLISLPLTDEGKILGNLNIYSADPEAFDEQEVGTLQELADDISFGISILRTRAERKKSLEEQQKYLDKIRSTLEATIQAIATTVELRDPYTAGHERRVAELAVAIAREMGLPNHQIEGIRVAATVHDLGKIQIPAEILSKPRSLNEMEFNFIKTHPLMGYNILKDIDFPWPIADIVLQHHERIDGSGYPNGLKGKRILLEARIVAVADTIEAMASHRPYRAGLGIRAALDEITAGKGKLYDPQAVEACINLFRKGYSLIE